MVTTQRVVISTDTWTEVADSLPCMIQFRVADCYMSIGNIPTNIEDCFLMYKGATHISGGGELIYVKATSTTDATVVVAK